MPDVGVIAKCRGCLEPNQKMQHTCALGRAKKKRPAAAAVGEQPSARRSRRSDSAYSAAGPARVPLDAQHIVIGTDVWVDGTNGHTPGGNGVIKALTAPDYHGIGAQRLDEVQVALINDRSVWVRRASLFYRDEESRRSLKSKRGPTITDDSPSSKRVATTTPQTPHLFVSSEASRRN